MSSYLEDVEFVLGEVIRFTKMDMAERRSLSFEDALSMIPGKDGRGSTRCGFKAEERLRAMARLAIERSSYAGRLDPEGVVRVLKSEISRRFITEGREVTAQEADRVVGAAIRGCSKNLKGITHLIPCNIADDKMPQAFSIGPVKFIRREARVEALKAAVERYAQKGDFERQASQDALEYYGSFNWLAEITLASAEPSVLRARAEAIAQHSLDCLHLLIGGAHSGHMRVAGPARRVDHRGAIMLGVDGEADASFSRAWPDRGFGEEWWARILDIGYGPVIELMGTVLKGAHDFEAHYPMAQRFLDAAAWYGEAVRDPFPASRAIKYMTAVERILTTKSEKDLTDTIAQRGSALLVRTGYEGDHRKNLREAYDLRSSLVHGSASPLDGDWRLLKSVESLSRRIVLSFLPYCEVRGLTDPAVSGRFLDSSYDRLVAAVASQHAGEATQQPVKPE